MKYHIKKCSFGFTLAEVLITLGIIGVVAAMTLPSVIASYNKKVWVAQLKKDVSYIQNNLRMIMAKEEVDKLSDTSVVYMSNPSTGGNYSYRLEENQLQNYLKLKPVSDSSKFYTFMTGVSGDSDNKGFYLNDGSCISYSTGGSIGYIGSEENRGYAFLVDVNCDKSPNKSGRDRFALRVDDYAKLVFPYYMDEDATLEVCNKLNDKNTSGLDDEVYEQLLGYSAAYCSYKIMQDGWEMKY